MIDAFSNLIIAKQNMLRSASQHCKVQVPNWIPFCYCVISIIYNFCVMNKHNNRKPVSKQQESYFANLQNGVTKITIPT